MTHNYHDQFFECEFIIFTGDLIRCLLQTSLAARGAEVLLDAGAQAQKQGVQVESTFIFFSQSNFETGSWCFQACRVSLHLHRPHLGPLGEGVGVTAAVV